MRESAIYRCCLLLVLVLGMARATQADSVYLTTAELDGFSFLSATGPGAFAGAPFFTGNGHYSVIWPASAIGPATVTSRVLLFPRGVSGDTFNLIVANTNENAWDFAITIFDGTVQTTGPISLLNGSSQTFSFLLSGPMTEVRVTVGGSLPVNGNDRNAEYRLVSVPEPASIALLGMGLLALGSSLRKKFKKAR